MINRISADADARRARILRAVTLIRVVVFVAALAALGIFLMSVGLDPASAGKEIGH